MNYNDITPEDLLRQEAETADRREDEKKENAGQGWLSIPQAAKELGVTRQYVYSLIDKARAEKKVAEDVVKKLPARVYISVDTLAVLRGLTGKRDEIITCPQCTGLGEWGVELCPRCNGKGELDVDEE